MIHVMELMMGASSPHLGNGCAMCLFIESVDDLMFHSDSFLYVLMILCSIQILLICIDDQCDGIDDGRQFVTFGEWVCYVSLH